MLAQTIEELVDHTLIRDMAIIAGGAIDTSQWYRSAGDGTEMFAHDMLGDGRHGVVDLIPAMADGLSELGVPDLGGFDHCIMLMSRDFNQLDEYLDSSYVSERWFELPSKRIGYAKTVSKVQESTSDDGPAEHSEVVGLKIFLSVPVARAAMEAARDAELDEFRSKAAAAREAFREGLSHLDNVAGGAR